MNVDELFEGIRKKDLRSISRSISIFEDDLQSKKADELMKRIYPITGNAQIIGITGPPGVGKSTLMGRLSRRMKETGKDPALIAIDASSPFSRGSFLGNRIRMQDSLRENGIFMRSLSNRGFKGGLSLSALGAVKVLDASGFDPIIIETVGSGQSDLDIISIADTTAVILAPGLGDEIQAIKAGIMEIGDIFVVNKIDREGAFLAMKDIQDILSLGKSGVWVKPVIGTNSLTGEGLDELINEIDQHRKFLGNGHGRDSKPTSELYLLLENKIRKLIDGYVSSDEGTADIIDLVRSRKIDPYEASESIIRKSFNHDHGN
ncbi:MAG: methylmalonyl Co-A mutase-associated GTPase MeaB [Thermoplasmata archaeon]